MDLGLFDKMKIIFDLLFSSFMSIEIFLFFLLLFVLVIVNIKVKNRLVPIILTFIVFILIIAFIVGFSSYALTCIDSFIMKIMDYYYFPSTVVFFFIFLFMVGVFVYTMFCKKKMTFKKVFNYICSVSVFFFFAMFTSLAIIGNLDLVDIVALYENNQILTVVQFSNLIVLLWIIVTLFYHLYLFFKKKFDNEKVEN